MGDESAGNGVPRDQALRPSEVAKQLGVSSATLRRWSRRFEAHLALSDDQEGRSHRRYTGVDLRTLERVKSLLDQGYTYQQVADYLKQVSGDTVDDAHVAPSSLLDEELDDQEREKAVSREEEAVFVPSGPESRALDEPVARDGLSPAAQFLRDTIQSITDNQQIILNAQQGNRDLLGVMIQDNLNLKGENTTLRDRMLELERELAEMRRRHADYREQLDTRVRVLEDAVSTLMARRQPATPPPAQQMPQRPPERRSFWARLIGG